MHPLSKTQGSVMKWLKRMLGLGGVDTEAVMDHALQLARSGQQVEAIAQMQAAVDSVKESAGCPSCEYAKGLFNLAMLHIAMGDMAQGAEDCRLAADSCPDTTAGRKDRLMYLMNAGQLLNRAGQTDAAIEVLQTSLREREAAYGPEHAGTAYGQQALAEVYMSAGRFDEGLELSEKALTTFLHTGSSRVSNRTCHHDGARFGCGTVGRGSLAIRPRPYIQQRREADDRRRIGPGRVDARRDRNAVPEAIGGLGLRLVATGFAADDERDCTCGRTSQPTRAINEQRQMAIERAVDEAKKARRSRGDRQRARRSRV